MSNASVSTLETFADTRCALLERLPAIPSVYFDKFDPEKLHFSEG